jgi:PPM family protein phosphatase
MPRDNSSDKPHPDVTPFPAGQHFPPLSSRVDVEFGAHSCPGTLHSINEDHYLIVRLGRHQETVKTSLPSGMIENRFEEQGYAMVVADGIGGSDGGEAAGRMAITTLLHLVRYLGKWNLRIDEQLAHEIMQRAEQFYQHIDVAMAQSGPNSPQGLQTTMTAVFGAGRDAFFAHIGHSRAYLFREGQLMRLTHDHTVGGQSRRGVVARLVDVNALARDLKHVLTQTLGTGSAVPTIDIERFQLDDGDVVLVCTNGLTDMVLEDTLAEVLGSSRSPDEQSRALVDRAIDAGGEDDATALIAQFHVRQ